MKTRQGFTCSGPAARRTGLRRVLAAAFVGAGALGGLVVPLTPGPGTPAARAAGVPLESDEVLDVVTRAVHYARQVGIGRPLSIAVSDVEGNGLGVFHMTGVPAAGDVSVLDPNSRERRTARALAKAGTVSYFSSDEESFTTRTAAFIIQDHFPPGLRFAPGGPLYGVEFSSIGTTDVNSITYPVPAASFETRVRGDLGAVALYKGGRRVGGVGLDDGDDGKQISIPDRVLFGGACAAPYRLTHANLERGRQLERVVLAAARPYLPPPRIRAGQITVDGIRLPFSLAAGLPESPAPPIDFGDDGGVGPNKTRAAGADGEFDAAYPLRGASGIPSRFVDVTLDPPPGAGPGQRSYAGQMPAAFPVRDGTDGILTADDVRRMLWQGARRANITRGAIRRPIGLKMQCWISVVDTKGAVLGVFRFQEDATLFSYDVAVQKARTAMFFSDDRVAWSSRGVGLFSQAFYPAGQQGKFEGPLFQLQDGITVGLLTGAISMDLPSGDPFPLRNGITVFAGGVPVYRDGRLAGGVGVSGDGIDQDDIVATFAAEGFAARRGIRCDAVGGDALNASLRRAVGRLEEMLPGDPGTCDLAAGVNQVGLSFLHDKIRDAKGRLRTVPFNVGPSYVKFPRHPGPVTIR